LFFKKEAFARIAENQVYDLSDLCRELIEAGQMAGYEVRQRFFEIGSFKGLEETRRYIERSEGDGHGR
jgi:NDP-sugar pyrophosphorylase family protein